MSISTKAVEKRLGEIEKKRKSCFDQYQEAIRTRRWNNFVKADPAAAHALLTPARENFEHLVKERDLSPEKALAVMGDRLRKSCRMAKKITWGRIE